MVCRQMLPNEELQTILRLEHARTQEFMNFTSKSTTLYDNIIEGINLLYKVQLRTKAANLVLLIARTDQKQQKSNGTVVLPTNIFLTRSFKI